MLEDVTSWNALLGTRSAGWHKTNLSTASLPSFLYVNVSLATTMCFDASNCKVHGKLTKQL